jgi:hypothetical protein
MIRSRKSAHSRPLGSVPAALLLKLSCLCLSIFGALGMTLSTASALPVYSRQYGVACSNCHSVPPRLNKFGYAFQANHFNWPGDKPLPRKDVSTYLPVTTLTTFSYVNDFSGRQETADFRSFEIFLSSGLGIDHGRKGGYFIDLTAASRDGTNGGLDNAYVAFPLAGRRGQLSFLVGQATPLLFQYDPVNSLTDTLPYGLTEGIDAFAFAGSTPMLRLDYFDNRGKVSPDGNYLSVAAPFRGHLELTRNGTVGVESGVFAQAFHRWGFATAGVLAYLHKDSNMEGLIGTYAPRKDLYLTGTAALAHQPGINTTHLALEAEYLPTAQLAFTGRAELIGGGLSEVATVAALNYYPRKNQYLRLSAEVHQRRQDRAFDLTLRVQY